MHIALIGYGRMGQAIHELARQRQHHITIIEVGDELNLNRFTEGRPDVAIEFTVPESAPGNLRTCFDLGIPVVCGTTGWLEHRADIESYCLKQSGTFFYASNFSIGVNMFFRLNEFLARLMNGRSGEYQASVHEIHHTGKKDAPSGTAITLAEGILGHNHDYSNWGTQPGQDQVLPVTSERLDPFPGTHIIRYSGPTDEIVISHAAHSRQGFAAGALAVAEWLPGNKGILGMRDFLPF